MTSTNSEKTPAAQVATRQSRREALKRFGRYAAAAPTTMILLEPHESHAGKSNSRGRGKGGNRGKGGRGGRGGSSGY
jgi:hypothetical protein